MRPITAVKPTEEERKFVYHKGVCQVGSCGVETACNALANNTYTCICPHDSSPPTSNGTCPRKLVSPEPGRIPNVQPPSNKHISTTSPTNSTLPVVQSNQIINNFIYTSPIFIVGTIVVLFFLLLLSYCWFRRRLTHQQTEASPINLKHNLLVAERYTPNPQYSACSGAGVAVLRKETLIFVREIGEGCFGKVFKGQLLSEEGDEVETVAIKVLKESASREAEEDFLREVEIMSAFRHPNILFLLGVVLREGNVSPMMVFEYMPLGDLAELLRVHKTEYEISALTSKDLLSMALQIANGMKYLAAQRFVHRDLACRNCLVADGLIVKIADFGMSRDVYTCDYYKIGGSRLLPVRWMSPESVVYGRFTLESDIWSFGVVLWEIYSFGKQPYYGHTNEEVVKLILDGIMLIPPEDCPSFICELMQNCWKTEPKHRITFPSICDKLELTLKVQDSKSSSSSFPLFEYDNEKKPNTTLPRPPPLTIIPVCPQLDLLDSNGYLLPKEVKEPVQYLETMPD